MPADRAPLVAVLSGDLVASRRLTTTALDSARDSLQASAQRLAHWRPSPLAGALRFARGDSWLLVLREPRLALRAALCLRSALLGALAVDTRVAIGIGTAQVLRDDPNLSSGAAFILAGEQLDKLDQQRLALGAALDRSLALWVALALNWADRALGAATQRQAQMLALALPPGVLAQGALGARLQPPVSQQAVAKGLRAAGWPALAQTLSAFESIHWNNN